MLLWFSVFNSKWRISKVYKIIKWDNMFISFVKHKELCKCLSLLVTTKSAEEGHRKEPWLLWRIRQTTMEEIAFVLSSEEWVDFLRVKIAQRTLTI